MQYINRLSNAPYQRSFLTGNPDQRIIMTVRYLPSQRLWAMDIVWDDFELYGITIVNGFNLLRNFRNVIPFGIACNTVDGQDPYTLDAFATGYAKLYLLTAAEMEAIEIGLFT